MSPAMSLELIRLPDGRYQCGTFRLTPVVCGLETTCWKVKQGNQVYATVPTLEAARTWIAGHR